MRPSVAALVCFAFCLFQQCFAKRARLVFDIGDFGARPGNKTHGIDSATALQRAFDAASEATSSGTNHRATVYIPPGDFRILSPVRTRGLRNIRLLWRGTLHLGYFSYPGKGDNSILFFQYAENLLLQSEGGIFMGYGVDHRPNGKLTTDARWNLVRIKDSRKVKVNGLTLIDSPKFHLNAFNCTDTHIDNIKIWMPPPYVGSTDGIDVSGYNVRVTNVNVTNGDDCVTIKNDSKHIRVKNVECHHGGGVTIGSAGHNNTWRVEDVKFENVALYNTNSGAEIKSFLDCNGTIKDVKWSNIVAHNVSYVAAIKLNWTTTTNASYSTLRSNLAGTRIENVVFDNFSGTSSDVVKVDKVSGKKSFRPTVTVDCPPQKTTCSNIDFKSIAIPDRAKPRITGGCGNGLQDLMPCIDGTTYASV